MTAYGPGGRIITEPEAKTSKKMNRLEVSPRGHEKTPPKLRSRVRTPNTARLVPVRK